MRYIRIICSIFCILIVLAAGCVLPGSNSETTRKEDSDNGKALATRLTLSFGDDTGDDRPATPAIVTPTPTLRRKPAFYGSSSRTINGSGLAGNVTNSTSTLVKYLTDDSSDANQIAILAEKEFWNTVGREIREKIDSGNTITRSFALAAVSHSGTYNAEQVCDLHDAVAPPVWIYVNDPADPDVSFWDYFAAASESITIGLKGDCDDYAILNAALVEAIGGSSRVVYAVHPTTKEAHMYAEARFSGTSFVDTVKNRYNVSEVRYRPGNWLNLDWQDTYPGGTYYADTGIIWVIYEDGSWEKLQKNGTAWNVILSGP